MRSLAWAILASLGAALPAAAQQDTSIQEDIQRRVQAETDQTVRRIQTMLRAMAFYRLDKAEENAILEDVARSLAGLSKDQMSQVIARLREAARASDEKAGQGKVDEAYSRHREIIDALNRLLSRYDLVRSLEQASERMAKLSFDELELHLQAVQAVREGMLAATMTVEDELLIKAGKEKRSSDQRKRLERSAEASILKLTDDQGDLSRQLTDLLTQLAELKKQLPEEQKKRLGGAEAMVQERAIKACLEESIRKLRHYGTLDQRASQRKAAAFLQWKAAGDFKESSRALRPAVEDLEALREARQLLERLIGRETALQGDCARPSESKDWDLLERRGQDLGNRQARVEFETRDLRVMLKPRAVDLSDRIVPAEGALREAQDLLRDRGDEKAGTAQAKAAEILRSVLLDLVKRITELEKAKQDPLAALQKAADTLEKLIVEQKDTRQKTAEADQAKKEEALAPLAKRQEDLQARTEDLKNQPLPDREKIAPALDKATKAQDKAVGALEDKAAAQAIPEQNKAVEALEDARDALKEAIADAQKQQDQALPSAAQQIAKAIEQAQAAQKAADEAAKDVGQQPSKPETGRPTLAELQKQLADQAKDAGLPQAAQPADAAAQALEKGNLQSALEQQKAALAQLEAAATPGQPSPAQPSQPSPAQPSQPSSPQAAPLAQAQQKLIEATQALADSQAANAAAQAAVDQAQALAPSDVQPQLAQAEGQLGKASEALGEAAPAEAGEAQGKAVEALSEALAAVNEALAAQGLPAVTPGQPSDATASAKEPGEGQGKEPGQGQGKEPGQGQGKEPGQGQGQEPGQGQGQEPGQGEGQEPGQGQGKKGKSKEINQSKGSGNREPDGTLKNAASQLTDVKGGESFLHLPPRQRDLIRQALSAGLPPEYAALIQQYYVNLARGRAAATPAAPDKK